MKNNRSLLIIIILVVVVSFIFVGFAYTSLYIMKNMVTRGIEMQLVEVADQGEQQLQNKVEGHFKVLRTLATEYSQRNADEDSIKLLDFEAERNQYIRIGFINSNGVAKTTDGEEFYAGDRQYFQNSLAGQESISNILEDRLNNDKKKIVVLSVPVVNGNKMQGVLFATLEKSRFNRIINMDFYKGKGYALIINNDGEIIFNSSKSEFRENLFNYLEMDNLNKIDKEIAKNKNGIICEKIGGEEKFIGYKNIPNMNNWNFITVIPKEVALGEMAIIHKNTVILISLLIVIFWLISLYNIYNKYKVDKIIFEHAYKDSLTEIGNRNCFFKNLSENLTLCTSNSILVAFDIRNFKVVNSVGGYSTGNKILEIIAKALKTLFSKEATYARFSSDNFYILFYNCSSPKEIEEKLNIFESFVYNNFKDNNIKINVSFNYGIYQRFKPKEDVLQAIDKADLARKHGKIINSKYILFEDYLIKSIREDYIIEEELKKGLKSNQLKIYLQPKYNFSDLSLNGAEALIRWNHPSKGFMSPEKFIPVAERTGLIIDIGRFVFEQVCKFLYECKVNELCVYPIAINFSLPELYQSDFIDYLDETMKKYAISGEMIEIEITESTIISDISAINNIIFQLKNYGIKVSMDDFGTGYSSLNHLKIIPIDCLKLDKSFIDTVEKDNNSKNIIKIIIDLAKSLNLKTVAEGIETKDQVELLKKLGCDCAQGYYFAKPMPLSDYKKMLFKLK